ncbi:hypothetical protein HEK616_36260 [Streptomyces nigrescens]|uniref:Transposase n=1 Tax=Streptomyces nigrescens TaxID=1920 RepID=A0ABM7ZUT8_STRNI|nr:hypothetical protein HEK616_36260 [Streptomyces nigrescens]
MSVCGPVNWALCMSGSCIGFPGRPRESALAYLRGPIAPLERKNGWTLAEQAGHAAPDRIHRLLNRIEWNAHKHRCSTSGELSVHHERPSSSARPLSMSHPPSSVTREQTDGWVKCGNGEVLCHQAPAAVGVMNYIAPVVQLPLPSWHGRFALVRELLRGRQEGRATGHR